MGIAGCSGNLSLQETFEKQMKDDGIGGFNIIHIDEKENSGLVLFTSWTEQDPNNKDDTSIHYFEKPDQRWERQTGMECSTNGVGLMGLMGNGYLFCSIFKANMDFEKIRIGDSEVDIFNVNDSMRVWYAVVDDRDSKVLGITSDGRDFALN
jgi:hypothetical protein